MAERVKKDIGLSQEGVKAAVEKYGQEEVQRQFSERGLIGDASITPVPDNKPTEETVTDISGEPQKEQSSQPKQIKTDLSTGTSTVVDTGKQVQNQPISSQVDNQTDTTIEVPKSIEEWKTRGSDIATLEEMIETKYGTIAENNNGVLTADINGVQYQWNIDDAGNPSKTKVGGENTSDIFARLMAGQDIEDTGVKTSQAYSKAKARYDIANKYVGMTESELYSAYINGEIGADLEKDIANNPYLPVAKEKYNKYLITKDINEGNANALNLYKKGNGEDIDSDYEIQKSAVEIISDKLIALLTTKGTDIQSFKQYMADNNPELNSEVKEYNQKNEDLQKLVDQRDKTFDEIIKDHPGISLNRATLLAARDNKAVNEQIKTMGYELQNMQSNINYKSSMAEKEYGYMLQSQGRQDLLDKEARGYAFDVLKTADARAYNETILTEQRQYEADNKGVTTSMIQVGNKQQLINSQTGELIKEYDMATGTASSTKAPETKNMGTSDNPDWKQYNPTTGNWDSIASGSSLSVDGVNYSTLDYSTNTDLINQYPGEASFQNNNPTGLSYGLNSKGENVLSENLTNLFNAAGINYSVGTHRPTNEGGNYIHFDSVQDGLDAYEIALTEAGSQNIYNRLATWVGTKDSAANDKYARDLMVKAGIEKGATFNEIDDTQLAKLMTAQLKQESPNYYKELMNPSTKQETESFDTASIPQFTNYLKNGKIGTSATEIATIKKEFGSVENFKKQAENYNNSAGGPRQKEIDKIKKLKNKVQEFISDDNERELDNSIGAYQWSAYKKIPLSTANEKEAYLAKIDNFLSGKTLQELIDVKGEGATFGALSNEELRMLQTAATELNNLATRDKVATGTTQGQGRITGFRGTKENFIKISNELIKTYTDIIKKKEEQMGIESTSGVRYNPSNTGGRWEG